MAEDRNYHLKFSFICINEYLLPEILQFHLKTLTKDKGRKNEHIQIVSFIIEIWLDTKVELASLMFTI